MKFNPDADKMVRDHFRRISMSSTTGQNKQIATEFYRLFDANDIPGVLQTMTDDATFWIAGKPGAARVAGTQTKAQIAQIFNRMLEQMPDGLRMSVKSAVAEGDKVALEVASRGELKNGRIYENEYHALMTIRGGKIAAVREYMDTQHVAAIWFAP
jgi:uncharacterized protein